MGEEPTPPGARRERTDLGGEIRLGSMLFTLVEPHQGHEVAYNRWYERDHFYAGCMVGPWMFSGRRFVATRTMKDLRFPVDPPMFGDHRSGSYLAVYWVLADRHDDHFAWALRQVRWLHEHERMFAQRDHIHTLLYRYRGAVHRDHEGVPPELALDHPFPGMAAVMVERTGAMDVPRPPLSPGSAVAMALTFDPVPLPPDAPVSQPGLERLEQRELQLWFCDTEPEIVWPLVRAYAGAVHASGAGTVLWAAPFLPTVPGTDRYVDQLW
jgi:hypothetical protein